MTNNETPRTDAAENSAYDLPHGGWPKFARQLERELNKANECAEIGKRWRANNSLEEWFPFSAQKLKSLEVECGNAAAIILKQDAEINSLRAQLEPPNAGADAPATKDL